MARITTTIIALSLFFSHALLPITATPLKTPTLTNVSPNIPYAGADEAVGELIAYHKDGAVAGTLPKNALRAQDDSGCRVMTPDEVRALRGWPDIEAYAKRNFNTGSYTLVTDYNNRRALVCADSEPSVLNADAEPSCTTEESKTDETPVGIDGTASMFYTEGYTTTSDFTVTQSAKIGKSMTATVGFKVFDVLGVGASETTSTEVTNKSGKGFTVAQESKDVQTITVHSTEGKKCHFNFKSKTCNVQGSGIIRYIASGYVWFMYNSPTKGHYRWAAKIDNVLQELEKRTETATINGTISGSSTSDYQGECV
jgi:hypothetical protein